MQALHGLRGRLEAWKRMALPPQDEKMLTRRSLIELDSIQLGFPGIEDGAFVLADDSSCLYMPD